jgi:hypothetical protein
MQRVSLKFSLRALERPKRFSPLAGFEGLRVVTGFGVVAGWVLNIEA